MLSLAAGGAWAEGVRMGVAGNLVPIGRFSQICRLTIKALRYYDDQGLLKPALVDPQSGYRYYGLGQVAVAERIRALRAIDMPLEEIAAALREADPVAISARLTVHQRRLEQQIAALESSLASLLGMLEPGNGARYEMRVVDVPERSIVTIGAIAPPTELSRVIPRTMAAVEAYLHRSGAAPAGPPLVIYHDGDDSDNFVMEIGYPVAAPQANEGAFTSRTLRATPAAHTTHSGPYDLLSHAYSALAGWIEAEGHEADGPPWEIYPTDGPIRSPHDYRTEIYWPLREAARDQ
jgi:DNA-binding transcriptional MerR regulator/predicted transcriptional regulator YdeE